MITYENMIKNLINQPKITIEKNDRSSCYTFDTNEIKICLPDINNNWSDEDILNRCTDIIIHEYLHYLMFKLFKNSIITCLFDAIGNEFRLYPDLVTKQLRDLSTKIGYDLITHEEKIKICGFKSLLDYYRIDEYEVKRAFEKILRGK
jgi:hypothetical protein